MKTGITYCLLFLFSLAFSYKTITYFSQKLSDGFQIALADYESENDSESDDKKEKKETSVDFYFSESHDLKVASKVHSSRFSGFIFSFSEYSQTIYSPPEIAIV